jgi:Ni,Fe-hydrogenase III large subunit
MTEPCAGEIGEATLARWMGSLEAVPIASCPMGEAATFRQQVVTLCGQGARLVALFAPSSAELVAVVARDHNNELGVLRAALDASAYPALTPELPSAEAFEREILEVSSICPEGHPWPKPLRRHSDLEEPPCPNHAHPFFTVDGPGVHEVAVGPVHAGIIEPGHFRFQCAGETVLHLEIQLGYQHRGVEELFCRVPPARRLVLAESVAGDTAVGHATAYCAAMEALADFQPPLRAQALRGIALELERLANHVGDLGALCGDVGYLPGASWLGRLRGEFLNLLFELSGSRFGRGLACPGGVEWDATAAQIKDLLARLAKADRDLGHVTDLVFGEPTVASRFEQCGPVPREMAAALGLVGPAARASGCDRDVRRDHPAGIYRFTHLPVAVAELGDVMARALVRSVEAKRSLAFLREQLRELPDGLIGQEPPPLEPERLVVSLVEGWRGEIAHVASTDREGRLGTYKIVDPSFHNWFGLTLALRGQPISDFPLCNKSFNLSYAGHDL